jgi:hypothetical protein
MRVKSLSRSQSPRRGAAKTLRHAAERRTRFRDFLSPRKKILAIPCG